MYNKIFKVYSHEDCTIAQGHLAPLTLEYINIIASVSMQCLHSTNEDLILRHYKIYYFNISNQEFYLYYSKLFKIIVQNVKIIKF